MNGPKYELENVIIFNGQIYLNDQADKAVSLLYTSGGFRLKLHQLTLFNYVGCLRAMPGCTFRNTSTSVDTASKSIG